MTPAHGAAGPRTAAETVVADADFNAALAVGQIVEVHWREGAGSRRVPFCSNARITKLTPATATVRLLEFVPGAARSIGAPLTVDRWPHAQWPLGLYPRSTHRVTTWEHVGDAAPRLVERVRCPSQEYMAAMFYRPCPEHQFRTQISLP